MAIVTPERPAAPSTPPAPGEQGPGRTLAGGGRAVGRAVGRVVASAGGSARRHRLLRWVVAAAVLAAGTLVAVDATSTQATYPLSAVFAKAPGLFAGASVEVLGVPVGTVTSVRNVADRVVVGMDLDAAQPVPAGARATLVEPELLGEPDIELDPGYTAGPVLAPGTTIPESRTAEPVSTEQLLKSLQHTLDAINPHAVGGLITNLAQDLDGQGKDLNRLIATAAGTIQLLADKGDDLGKLNGTLAQLTGTLDSRSAEITKLITDYDTVSGVVAQHGAQLGDAITQLSSASTQLVQLLTPDLASLEQDVGTLTTAGRTVDRNLGNVDQALTSATALFSAAERAYDPTYNWLNLNLQLPAGVTGAYLAGLVRDRLAGVCRRIDAHHAAGLSATALQTLQSCGDPSSGFFDPIVDQIPTILNDIAAGNPPTITTSPASMLQQGLAEIPGLSQAAPSPSTTPAAPSAPSPSTPTPATPAPSTTTTTTAPPVTPCLGGLLGSVATCSSGSGSGGSGTTGGSSGSGSGGSTSTTSGSGGLGGLLSYRQPLTAPSAGQLPPLPASAPGASRAKTHDGKAHGGKQHGDKQHSGSQHSKQHGATKGGGAQHGATKGGGRR
ncbi:MAG TPA: MCE family protein [Acidimicrobiales bacterium]|nr:MCE family protein [Acidimicrobiales bacterium]